MDGPKLVTTFYSQPGQIILWTGFSAILWEERAGPKQPFIYGIVLLHLH